jgi:hypothetical protein
MPKPTAQFTPASSIALLALVGYEADPARGAGIASTMNSQVRGASKAFGAVPFETEPATYLKVSAGEKP